MGRRKRALFLYIGIVLYMMQGIPVCAANEKVQAAAAEAYLPGRESDTKLRLTVREQDFLQEKRVLRAAVVDTFSPYIYKELSGDTYAGYAVDLLNILREESGIDIVYVKAENYLDCTRLLKDGTADVAVCTVKRGRQEQVTDGFAPFMESAVQLIAHKDSGLNARNAMRAARVAGTDYLDMKEYGNTAVYDFETMEECLEAVRDGQADFAVCDLYTATALMNRLAVNDLSLKNVPEHYVTMGFQTAGRDAQILSGILGKLRGALSTVEKTDRLIQHGEWAQRKEKMTGYVYGHPFELLCAVSVASFTLLMALFIHTRIRMRQQRQLKDYEGSCRMLADTFGYAGLEYDFLRDTLTLFGERHDRIDLPETVEKLHEKLKKRELRITLTAEEFDRICMEKEEKKTSEAEFQCGMSEGGWNWFRLIYIVVCTEESNRPIRLVGCLMDAQKQHTTEEKLVEIGQYDTLTGIYNRAGAEGLIKEALEYLEEYSQNVFLLMDVDRFKQINDSNGHLCGDDVLRTIGTHLREIFEGDTVVCRWGGDEFIMFVRGPGAEQEILKKRLKELIRRMKKYEYEGRNYPIGLSIGGIIPVKGMKLHELFQQADEVLYHVKEKGRDSFLIRKASG